MHGWVRATSSTTAVKYPPGLVPIPQGGIKALAAVTPIHAFVILLTLKNDSVQNLPASKQQAPTVASTITRGHAAFHPGVPRYPCGKRLLSEGVLERALGGELLLSLHQDFPDGHEAVSGAAGLWGEKFQGKFREN